MSKATISVGVHLAELEDIELVVRILEGVPAHMIDIGGMLGLTLYATLEQIEQIGNTLLAYAMDVRLGAPLDKYGYFPHLKEKPDGVASLIEGVEQDA